MLFIINKLQLSVSPGHLSVPVSAWQMRLNTQMKTSKEPSGTGKRNGLVFKNQGKGSPIAQQITDAQTNQSKPQQILGENSGEPWKMKC